MVERRQFCNSSSSPYLVFVFSHICKPVRPPILERVANDLRLQRSAERVVLVLVHDVCDLYAGPFRYVRVLVMGLNQMSYPALPVLKVDGVRC
jgi:hypothetical protein